MSLYVAFKYNFVFHVCIIEDENLGRYNFVGLGFSQVNTYTFNVKM